MYGSIAFIYNVYEIIPLVHHLISCIVCLILTFMYVQGYCIYIFGSLFRLAVTLLKADKQQ